MAQLLIPIPEGFRHSTTTAFAETQEAYDSYDLPETIHHHGGLSSTKWKEIKVPDNGTLLIFPPVMSQ